MGATTAAEMSNDPNMYAIVGDIRKPSTWKGPMFDSQAVQNTIRMLSPWAYDSMHQAKLLPAERQEAVRRLRIRIDQLAIEDFAKKALTQNLDSVVRDHERASEMGDPDGEESGLILEAIGGFRGVYPEVLLPADIAEEMKGELTYTLPIGKVGAKSRNNRVYTKNAVERLVAQVNDKRPEGRWGHLAESERATRYDPPAVRWLAATLDEQGTAWGKLLPITETAKEHFRIAKLTKAKVGTSLYGTARMKGDQVIDLILETIDLADPERVGVLEAAATVKVTKEMQDDTQETVMELEKVLAELTAKDIAKLPEPIRQAIIAEHEATQKSAARIAEMESQAAAKDKTISELNGQLAELAGKQFTADLDEVVAELIVVEQLRPMVRKSVLLELGGKRDLEAAKKALSEYVATDEYKTLAKLLVGELAGPAAILGGKANTGTPAKLDTSAEATAAARARTGF
jgi:uncharacterized coiled-coil protein SlyX